MQWLQFFLIIAGCVSCAAEISPLANQIAALLKTSYGYSLVDLGFTPQDYADFNQIQIRKTLSFHQFDNFQALEARIIALLNDVGPSDVASVQRVAARITTIVAQIMAASGESAAWVNVSASLPTNAYDISRWHMDGYYFTPVEPMSIMYKFIMTLVGPSTLFYQCPKDIRQEIKAKTSDRLCLQSICTLDKIVVPRQGQGVFFLSGRTDWSALHSEPKIDAKRLFFSVVPCSQKQVVELKKKVARTAVLDA